MTESTLWAAYVGPPGVGTTAQLWTFGDVFIPTVDGEIRKLGWFRAAVGGTWGPSALMVYDLETQQRLVFTNAITDNNAVAWQWSVLSAPLGVLAGRAYIVAGYYPSGRNFCQITSTGKPAAGANLSWHAQPDRRIANVHAFPSGATDPNITLLDITFSDVLTPGTDVSPVTGGEFEDEMTAWHSVSDGTRADSATRLTYGEVTHPDRGLQHITDAVADVATSMLTAESEIFGQIIAKIDEVDEALDSSLGPGGNFLTGALRTYFDGLKDTVDNTLALAANIRGQAIIQPGTPGSNWSLVDTGTFDGPLLIDQEADRVTVVLTDWAAERAVNVYGGLTWFPQPIWWVPLRGGAVAGRYGTFLATAQDLSDPTGRMGGVFVNFPPDVSGSWELWRYLG